MSAPDLGSMPIDLPKLLESRLLLVAGSGSGKSYALRRVLEQTATHVQQLVIDPDGEFASLRERYDYIICAPSGADAVATPATATALATALWKAGTSAVLDISDLAPHDRISFVRRFFESLIAQPRPTWHSCLVALDEAQIFCPQVGDAESASAVIDMAARGRKRGICLLPATQRLAKLNKDVAAEMRNKLIGGMSLDIDLARAGDELGFSTKDRTVLRTLEPGEFFAYGPALCREVTRTRIGPVQTTHPQLGQKIAVPPPPSAKIRTQLGRLEGLQLEAVAELNTVDALRAELTKVRAQLKTSTGGATVSAAAPGVTEAEVRRRIDEAVAAARAEAPDPILVQMMRDALNTAQSGAKSIVDAVDAVRAHAAARSTPHFKEASRATKPVQTQPAERVTLARQAVAKAAVQPGSGMSGPEQRILDAIAWLEAIGVDAPEQPAVAFLAGYSYGGGAYNNPRGRLNQRGMVEYRPGGLIALTDAGRAAANRPPPAQSNKDLHERVLERLSGPEQRLLRPLLAAYPSAMSNGALAAAAGYTAGAGAFNNPRGKLRTLGLIDYPQAGHVVARPLLFPKGQK